MQYAIWVDNEHSTLRDTNSTVCPCISIPVAEACIKDTRLDSRWKLSQNIFQSINFEFMACLQTRKKVENGINVVRL